MGAKFDSETISLRKGDSLMNILKKALKKKGLLDRIEGDNAIFIIDDITIKSISVNIIVCEVEYEYSM